MANKESPPKEIPNRKRVKQSYEYNLLKRLERHQDAVLRSIYDPNVSFTNNKAENDIRMTKVHQKISGCFRSFKGAQIFCRIRSYLITCQLNNMPASTALTLLFKGQTPGFMAKSNTSAE